MTNCNEFEHLAHEAALHEQGHFSRRTLVRLASVGAAATALGVQGWGESPAQAANLASLKIGYLPITDASPLLIAHDGGFFKRNGIQTSAPTLFRSWPSLVEAFLAKRVDVIHLLMPLAIQLKFASNQDIKILTWNHTNGSALTVATRSTELATWPARRLLFRSGTRCTTLFCSSCSARTASPR